MEKIKPFGILFKDNKMVNHRSLLKIICNPILRVLSFQIVSYFDNEEFQGYGIMHCEWKPNIIKNYYNSIFTCNEYDTVVPWLKKKNINL